MPAGDRHHDLPVVHLGIDLPSESDAPDERAGQTILCVAQLIPLKRHVDLLEAVRELIASGCELVLELIGDGPELCRLQECARDLQIEDHIRFVGHLPHDAVLNRLRSPDIVGVVLASEIEGIPVSLMEGMAVGVPAICTDVGGVRELLDGGAGLLVPPGSVRGLASAMGRVLSDAESRRQLGRAGRARVASEFTAEATSIRLLSLILARGDE